MRIKKTLEKIVEFPKHNPIKTAIASTVVGGFLALSALTAIKDNIHFKALNVLTLYSPQKDQYVWGIWPCVSIEGDAKANVKTYGLIGVENELEENSSIRGNMEAYGLIVGVNSAMENSKIQGDMKSHSLLGSLNYVRENSSIQGDMKAYGGICALNEAENNAKINGNILSKGFFSSSPIGFSPAEKIDLLKDYTHKTGEK